jgi:hypothetical protein
VLWVPRWSTLWTLDFCRRRRTESESRLFLFPPSSSPAGVTLSLSLYSAFLSLRPPPCLLQSLSPGPSPVSGTEGHLAVPLLSWALRLCGKNPDPTLPSPTPNSPTPYHLPPSLPSHSKGTTLPPRSLQILKDIYRN